MASFWDLLRVPPAGAKGGGKVAGAAGAKPATAAELRAALAEAEQAAVTAEAEAAAVAQQRAAMLLEADDGKLDAIERRLQLAQREADRGAAAVEALRTRARDAEERERQENLDRLVAEGDATLRAAVEAYRVYGEMAAELRDQLIEIRQLHVQFDRIREGLRKAGDPRTPVSDLDEAVRPQKLSPRQAVVPVWNATLLPHPTDPLASLYPVRDAYGTPIDPTLPS